MTQYGLTVWIISFSEVLLANQIFFFLQGEKIETDSDIAQTQPSNQKHSLVNTYWNHVLSWESLSLDKAIQNIYIKLCFLLTFAWPSIFLVRSNILFSFSFNLHLPSTPTLFLKSGNIPIDIAPTKNILHNPFFEKETERRSERYPHIPEIQKENDVKRDA